MADHTPIEWTDATWNPVVGCSIHSPGCTNCYAMGMAARIEAMTAALRAKGKPGAPHYDGTTKRVNGDAVWTGKLALAPDHILAEPLRWKAPRRIFVNSMGDLFHEDVPDEWIDRVFAVIALAPQHTFQVLTKRAGRMRAYINAEPQERVSDIVFELAQGPDATAFKAAKIARDAIDPWPLPNVWLGVSAERQQEADERIPDLLDTPAAIRFVSAEPLLGPIDLAHLHIPNQGFGPRWSSALNPDEWGWYADEAATIRTDKCTASGDDFDSKLDWIIVGGESGPGARPMHPAWPRSIRDQCAAAGVPFFFKQWGMWSIAEEIREAGAPRFWRFADGDEFHIVSDGHDIIMAEAQDSTTPKHIWNGYWADGHGNLAKKLGKKRAGRLLDGREHSGFPEVPEVPFR